MTLLLALLASYLIHPAGGSTFDQADPSPWVIIHLALIAPAVPLGLLILILPKGSRTHRILGRIWATLTFLAACLSFGITELTGWLSPIHILSAITILSIPYAVYNIRRGNIAAHQRTMIAVLWGMTLAGLFAFLPGRLLGEWLRSIAMSA